MDDSIVDSELDIAKKFAERGDAVSMDHCIDNAILSATIMGMDISAHIQEIYLTGYRNAVRYAIESAEMCAYRGNITIMNEMLNYAVSYAAILNMDITEDVLLISNLGYMAFKINRTR